MAEQQTDRPGVAEAGPRPLEAVVFDALEMFGAERERITREARLADLEVDSLDIVELGQIIQDEYGVRLDLERFRGVETVGQALDVIEAQLA